MKLGDKVKFEIEGVVTSVLETCKEVRITCGYKDYYVPFEQVKTVEPNKLDAIIYALENCKNDFNLMTELYQAEVMTNGK